ncbi:MAG: hypothetical protein ACLFT4_00200 [Bacteroidales bacterium]
MALSDILKIASTATAFIPGAQGISPILGAGATIAGAAEKKKKSSQEPGNLPYKEPNNSGILYSQSTLSKISAANRENPPDRLLTKSPSRLLTKVSDPTIGYNDNKRASDLRTGDPFEDMDKEIKSNLDASNDKGYNFDKYLGRTPFDDLGLNYSSDFDQPSTKRGSENETNNQEGPGLVPESKTANTLNTIAAGVSGASALGSVVAGLNAGEPEVASYVKASPVTLDKDTSDFENTAEAERDRRFNAGVRFMSDMGMNPSLASSSLYGLTNRAMGETRASAEGIRREVDAQEKGINSRISLTNAQGMNQYNRFKEQLQLNTNQLNAQSVSSGLDALSRTLTGYGESRIGNKMYSDAIRQGKLLEGWV